MLGLGMWLWAIPIFAGTPTITVIGEPIIVTGTRIPTSQSQSLRHIRVIEREELISAPIHSVAEALEYATGVEVNERAPFGVSCDLSIRGSNFQGVLVLIDGMRVNNPQTGHHHLDIPLGLADIERIEVIGGHGSSIYGPDAAGGTVNIITRRESKDAEIETFYGEHETIGAQGLFTYRLRKGLKTIFGMDYKASDGQRYDTDFKVTSLTSHTFSKFSWGEADLFFGHLNKEFGAYDFYTPEAGLPSREWTKAYLINLGARIESKKIIIEPKLSFKEHRDEFVLKVTDPEYYHNYHTTYAYGPSLSLRGDLGRLGNLVVGGEIWQEEIDSSSLGEHAGLRTSLFGENRISYGILSSNIGLRLDDYSKFYSGYGSLVSPSISLGLTFSKTKLRLSYGESFRPPSFTDLFYSSPANLGDADLAPEEGTSYEAGFDYSLGKMVFRSTIFRRETKNLIDWVMESSTDRWKAENLPKEVAEGFETSLNLHPTKSLSLLFNYAYLDKEIEKSEDYYKLKYGEGYYKHLAGLGLWLKLPFGTQHIKAEFKEREDDAIFLLNLRLTKNIHQGEVYLEVKNLLDEKYEEVTGVSSPSRWIFGGLKLKL